MGLRNAGQLPALEVSPLASRRHDQLAVLKQTHLKARDIPWLKLGAVESQGNVVVSQVRCDLAMPTGDGEVLLLPGEGMGMLATSDR